MSPTRDVRIPYGAGEMRGVFATPDQPGPHPGVIVLHEIWGLNNDIRRIANLLAAEGYAALAPDIYSPGVRALCIAQTIVDMTRGGSRVVNQADAARAWLAGQPDVDAARVGAIGFCMGGGFALLLGVRSDVRAVSVNYGEVPKSIDDVRGVCPVVGSYGAEDKRFLGAAERLERFLSELKVPHDVKVYEGAGHSFLNQGDHPLKRVFGRMMPLEYKPDAAEDAWRRILSFFAEHI